MGGPVRDEGDAGEGALPRIAPAVVVNSDSVVAEQIAELMQLGGGEFSPGVADLPVEPLAVACRARWVAARHAGDDEATTPAPSGLPVGHSRPTRPARRHPLAAAVSQANVSGATDQHGSVALNRTGVSGTVQRAGSLQQEDLASWIGSNARRVHHVYRSVADDGEDAVVMPKTYSFRQTDQGALPGLRPLSC